MGKFDEKLYVSLTYPLLLQSCGGATNRNTEKKSGKNKIKHEEPGKKRDSFVTLKRININNTITLCQGDFRARPRN